MNAIEALTGRVSVAQLTGPDVTDLQLEIMFRAALRAADHGWLRPSRYLTVQGRERQALGQLFLECSANGQDLTEEQQQKLLNAPLRAPLVIVAISRVQEHPKVPRLEQLMSTAAGVQNLINAVWALGLGAIWRTGDVAHNRQLAERLGLDDNEHIVGFVYVGQINAVPKTVPELNLDEYVSAWHAKSV